MGTRVRTILMLVAGAIPVLIALVVGDYLADVQDEVAWRRHTDAMTYLREGYGNRFFEAQEEIERQQRAIGLVGRLHRLSFRGQTMQAAWSGDGRQLVTASGTVIYRWDAQTAAQLDTLGPATVGQADDPKRWGFGFSEATFTGADQRVVGLTQSPPKTLWTFTGRTAARMGLDGSGYEQLTAFGGVVGLIRNLEYGLLVDAATNRMSRLPHPEVTAITFLANGDVLTLARAEVRRWKEAVLVETIPLTGAGHPAGFSSDGVHFFVPQEPVLEVWSSTSGNRLWQVPLAGGGAYCANREILATGDKEGAVHIWSVVDGTAIRSFQAHANGITRLFCHAAQILSVADDGGDSRLWDVSGRPNAAPVAPAYPQEPNWLVRLGAYYRLPGRMPIAAQFFHSNRETIEMAGFGGLGLWVLAIYVCRRRIFRPR